MESGIRRIIAAQALLALVTAAGFGWWDEGRMAGLAALFGGAITMANTALMGWRLVRATDAAAGGASWGQFHLYFGVIERFVVALVLLGVGLGALGLAPIPLLVGFGVTQLGYLAKAYFDR